MVTRKQTKDALEGSIKKWELIESGIGVDDGVHNCPLCKIFNVNVNEYSCAGCPVDFATSMAGCIDTPYDEWGDHQFDEHSRGLPVKVECDKCKALAHEMLEFLISLRPVVDAMFDNGSAD